MQEQDRRKFFRIDHQVSLELKPISKNEMNRHPSPAQFEVSPYFLLLSQLQALDTESEHLLHKVAEKDSNTAIVLKQMQKKIDTIARAIATNNIDTTKIVSQEINLSEGGMMFEHPEELALGTFLAIKLIFPEISVGLLLYAKVCRVIPLENDRYKIGIEFIRLSENCRLLLARQIMLLQSRQRQREKHALENADNPIL